MPKNPRSKHTGDNRATGSSSRRAEQSNTPFFTKPDILHYTFNYIIDIHPELHAEPAKAALVSLEAELYYIARTCVNKSLVIKLLENTYSALCKLGTYNVVQSQQNQQPRIELIVATNYHLDKLLPFCQLNSSAIYLRGLKAQLSAELAANNSLKDVANEPLGNSLSNNDGMHTLFNLFSNIDKYAKALNAEITAIQNHSAAKYQIYRMRLRVGRSELEEYIEQIRVQSPQLEHVLNGLDAAKEEVVAIKTINKHARKRLKNKLSLGLNSLTVLLSHGAALQSEQYYPLLNFLAKCLDDISSFKPLNPDIMPTLYNLSVFLNANLPPEGQTAIHSFVEVVQFADTSHEPVAAGINDVLKFFAQLTQNPSTRNPGLTPSITYTDSCKENLPTTPRKPNFTDVWGGKSSPLRPDFYAQSPSQNHRGETQDLMEPDSFARPNGSLSVINGESPYHTKLGSPERRATQPSAQPKAVSSYSTFALSLGDLFLL